MEKDIRYYKDLLKRYTNDECSPEEIAQLMDFLHGRESNRLLLAEIRSRYNEGEQTGNLKITEHQSRRIRELLLQTAAAEKPAHGLFRIRNFVWAAAAVLLVCTGLYWFYTQEPVQMEKQGRPEARLIKPGTEKATLTFPDGTVRNLDEDAKGVLYQKDGLVISRMADGAIRYALLPGTQDRTVPEALKTALSTPVGGECRVVLPDGSRLWLNALSEVRFPVMFSKQERRVQARGEVYFEVAKNARQPFKVFSGGQVIEVLGTHFVVHTNTDNTVIRTTLLEGSIRLSNGKTTKILKPGQESRTAQDEQDIAVEAKRNAEAAVAWKDGYFIFDNTDFKTVEDQLSKWYDVEFVYDHRPDKLLYGTIERKTELAKVLKMLEIVGNIHFKTEGRKIYVTE